MDFETLNNSTFFMGGRGSTTFPYVQILPPTLESMTKYLLPFDLLHPLLDCRFFHLVLWCVVLLIGSLFSFYISTWISFTSQRLSRRVVKVPPMLPYAVPVIGKAIYFAFDPAKALARTSRSIGPRTVHGLKVLGYNVYFIFKPENIAKIWQYPTTITTPGVTTFVLRTVLGMAPQAYNMYTMDNSGILPNPRPGSHVAPHNRIDYLTHVSFHKHLLGEGLPVLFRSFATGLMHRISSLDIEDEWRQFPDVMDFWLPAMTSAMNEAIAGPILECVNPNFTRDFLRYYTYVHTLMKGFPRWCFPEPYRLQEELVRDVRRWHAIATACFQERHIDKETGCDPWWGSAFIRERQSILKNVENWDCDSIASSDFGLLWGASLNIHPMAIWNIIEVFRDKVLLSRVRAELTAAGFRGITTNGDIEQLTSIPLLQSIYMELLRLRVETQTVLTSDTEDICINEWRIPRNSLVIVPVGAAHRDPGFWNTRNGKYSLDRFWADRFLAHHDDPQSGPRKPDGSNETKNPRASKRNTCDSKKPKLVTSGLTNSYMPYGIGERTCPGRGFARREILAFCAYIVDQFDIEILSKERDFKTTSAFYGMGTQRPEKEIPFKIRKRKHR